MRKENFNEEKCSSPGICSSSPGGGGHRLLCETLPPGNRTLFLRGDLQIFWIGGGSAGGLSGRSKGAGREGRAGWSGDLRPRRRVGHIPGPGGKAAFGNLPFRGAT